MALHGPMKHHAKLLTLVIDKANTTSPVAGNSWMLYRNGEILTINSNMHGTDVDEFTQNCEQNGWGADLYLSSIPHRLFVDYQYLQNLAEQVGIKHIYYPELDTELRQKLCEGVDESKLVVPMTGITLRLSDLRAYQNLQHFHQEKRPWVIAISSGSFIGKETQLNTFEGEYGAYQYILEQYRKVHFVVEEEGHSFSDIQNERDRFGKPLLRLTVKDSNQLDTVFNTAFLNSQTSCVIMTSLSMVSELIAQKKVDEIIYYVSIKNGHGERINLFSKINENWEINDCQNLSNGIRVNLRKKGHYIHSTIASSTSVQ